MDLLSILIIMLHLVTVGASECGSFNDPVHIHLKAPAASNLTTPGYPGPYEPLINCYWRVDAGPGYVTSFYIDGDFILDVAPYSQCEGDFLELYDGNDTQSQLIDTYCGDAPSGVTHGQYMFVHFNSDADGHNQGFRLMLKPVIASAMTEADIHGLSDGAIAGIVIGLIVLLACILVFTVLYITRRGVPGGPEPEHGNGAEGALVADRARTKPLSRFSFRKPPAYNPDWARPATVSAQAGDGPPVRGPSYAYSAPLEQHAAAAASDLHYRVDDVPLANIGAHKYDDERLRGEVNLGISRGPTDSDTDTSSQVAPELGGGATASTEAAGFSGRVHKHPAYTETSFGGTPYDI